VPAVRVEEVETREWNGVLLEHRTSSPRSIGSRTQLPHAIASSTPSGGGLAHRDSHRRRGWIPPLGRGPEGNREIS
jgi:hypothetical protein